MSIIAIWFTYLVILEPNSVAHVSVGLNVIVLTEYSRLNISSAKCFRRLFNIVNLQSSTAGRRRRISSMQSSFKSLKLVFGFLAFLASLFHILAFSAFFLILDSRSLRDCLALHLPLDLVLILLRYLEQVKTGCIRRFQVETEDVSPYDGSN